MTSTVILQFSLSLCTHCPAESPQLEKRKRSKNQREREILLGICKASWHSRFSPLLMLDSQMTRHQAGTAILQLCPVHCGAPSRLPSSDQLSPVLHPHTTPVTSSPPAFKQGPVSRRTSPPKPARSDHENSGAESHGNDSTQAKEQPSGFRKSLKMRECLILTTTCNKR